MKHFFNINIILNLVKVETFVHNSSGLSSALNAWFDLLLDACKVKERGYLKAPPTCCSKHLFVRGSQSGGGDRSLQGRGAKVADFSGWAKESHTISIHHHCTGSPEKKKKNYFNTSNHLLSLNVLQWKDTVLSFHVQLGGFHVAFMLLLCLLYTIKQNESESKCLISSKTNLSGKL